MKRKDAIEDALTVLYSIREMLDLSTPIYPGALLTPDDLTIQAAVARAIDNLRAIKEPK